MTRTIKVECQCGARFAFDVEPVEGRMPVAVFCPVCGADATERANQVLAETEAAAGAAANATTGGYATSGGSDVRLRVHRRDESAQPGQGSARLTRDVAGERCPQHPDEVAVERCRVCGRPICRRCMELHGYTCSVLCRGRAERDGLDLPVYEGELRLQQARRRRLARWIGWMTAAALVTGLAYTAWWKWLGSKPRLIWSSPLPKDAATGWELAEPAHLLGWTARELTLRQLPEGRVVWRVSLETRPENDLPRLVSVRPWLVWLIGDRLEARDPASGEIRWSLNLPNPVNQVDWNGQALVAVSEGPAGTAVVTRVDLESGSSWRESVPPRPVPVARPGVTLGGTTSSPGRVPTAADAGRWIEEEETRAAPLPPPQRLFLPAGTGVAEFQWWMIERRIVEREGLRPRQGRSPLEDEQMTAGRSWGSVRQALNEIERIRSGGVVREDQSRYGVRLWRRGQPTAEVWSGEVVGRPWFIPLRTVDVVWAGTQLTVLDRQNRVRWTASLAYPAPEELLEGASPGRANRPCLELGDRLVVFDRGMITCFELATGQVVWRLPSVGTRRVVANPAGSTLFVATTTATVEDLKHPLEARLWERARPLILRVDAASGREVWRQVGLANECYLSDSLLYAWWLARGMSGEQNLLHLYRLDPANGRPLWHRYEERWPRRLLFQGRHLLLQWEDAVEVYEFRRP